MSIAQQSGELARLTTVLAAALLLASTSDGSVLATSTAQTGDGPRRVVAQRTSAPIHVDGHLNEEDWRSAAPAQHFTQSEPLAGQPASEITEVRILYDDHALYIGVFAGHRDRREIIVNELKRDFDGTSTDWFAVILDPFRDRRNGYQFGVNPGGAAWDSQKFNEGRERNLSWDGVWRVRTSIADAGWYAEYEIPFRTLQVPGRASQTWGINFQRHLQGRLENSFWSPVPRQYQLDRLSLAGVLEGLDGVSQGVNLRLKPYLSGRAHRTRSETELAADAGIDAKYALTHSLTADLTVNTDFSQVEADVQQVGATRFSVLFPEKREFFLENSGVFQFGPGSDRASQISLAPGTSAGGRDNSVRSDLSLFFSRRVGLAPSGESVPIAGGARLSGRIGRTAIGALHVRQAEGGGEPEARFSVLRLRRNVFAASDVGAMVVTRRDSTHNNQVAGIDVNLRPAKDLLVYGYVATTLGADRQADRSVGHTLAAQTGVAWRDGRWVLDGSLGLVGAGFVDEAGFVPRSGVRRTQGLVGRRFRPVTTSRWLREIYPAVGVTDVRTESGDFDSRYWEHRLIFTFERGAALELGVNPNDEQLLAPFTVNRHRGLVVAPGRYRFTDAFASVASSRSRRIAFDARVSAGGYYDGERQLAQAGTSARLNQHVSGSVSLALDRVAINGRSATGSLIISRLNVGVSTRLFANVLVQHNSNSGQWDTNVRVNYIHAPLSDIFVVFSERVTATSGQRDRSIVLKVTRLFAF